MHKNGWLVNVHTEYLIYTKIVNHYLNTRLSNRKELGNEYIATEAEEECGFCSRNYFKVDVLKRGPSLQQGVQF